MARRLLAACLLGMLVLSGCGGSPEDPPRTATSSPSPTKTTPPVPELPEAANADTKEGAEAFVRHYVDLLNHALVTGNTTALRAASDPGCGSCDNSASRVEQIYASDGSVVGGEWRIHGAIVTNANSQIRGWIITAAVHYDKQVVVEGTPSTRDTNKAGSMIINFSAAHRPRGWVLLDWTRGS